ncbi:RNA polymerase, sigma subunit, ECF family [Chishuiella changwenlii]|mgnify:CR=1 FL=1|jgi:RNA polymerase sigma-70 factor (ECF subfamily)|uniref:RNA polymerase subunit sigma-24 n=1 Tax=Chishuiella changwenlii TaxID=1434701 RepID=A0A1M6VFK1_9FLAO|nr:sigma-70 family RNA polymerase sigma factor [Chishuiella changwenlii]GGF10287.1 RNA polymerase subunit sigma-24 [Chishuiella changwenlii]SHK80134.1 RNA polymerase, sigma subunit, ECF family [Chishuiella changwenlii]
MNYEKDSLLIRDYINGNESALEILIDKYKSRIYSFIFSKVMEKDVTEDIFQDTFIKVILTLKGGGYNEEGKFLPWVMRIAHNLTIDYFRSNKKMPTVRESSGSSDDEYNIFDFLGNSDECSETKIIKNQIDQDLRYLVTQLPDDQREVLELRIFKELSFKEIAEETGVSINTALGRMRYAIINLRKVIENNNIILTVD